MKLLRHVAAMLLSTLVFGFIETVLFTFFDDPKFWGEASICAIASILVGFAYVEFIIWYVKHQKYFQFANYTWARNLQPVCSEHNTKKGTTNEKAA